MDSPDFDFIDPCNNAEWRPPREMLARRGVFPPVPGEVDERQMRGRLWEMIYALGALRFFLHDTDHLDDRALYTWLCEEWLDEPNADIPPEAEWNCHLDLADAQSDEGAALWLRHYATARDREQWARDFPEFTIPPNEWPPHDRDRFLPAAYPPPQHDASAGDDDPLGLAAVNREIRGEPPGPAGGFDSAAEKRWERPVETLSRGGFAPLPPDEITTEALPALLWELLHELACRGFYALHTDHLGDREVYDALWRRALREEAILPGKSPRAAWYHDFLGSGSEADTQLLLRFYASDEDRARHARDWPGEPLPPCEKPPHARDWRLPKGPF